MYFMCLPKMQSITHSLRPCDYLMRAPNGPSSSAAASSVDLQGFQLRWQHIAFQKTVGALCASTVAQSRKDAAARSYYFISSFVGEHPAAVFMWLPSKWELLLIVCHQQRVIVIRLCSPHHPKNVRNDPKPLWAAADSGHRARCWVSQRLPLFLLAKIILLPRAPKGTPSRMEGRGRLPGRDIQERCGVHRRQGER
jgi:hypothetical protein